jgi:hypothetical protein
MVEQKPWLHAEFNGLFGSVLCLTHRDFCVDEEGREIVLRDGMRVTAFDEDADDQGRPDRLFANGIVTRPPDRLVHKGSRWVLQIDEDGSDMNRIYTMPNRKRPRDPNQRAKLIVDIADPSPDIFRCYHGRAGVAQSGSASDL